MLRNLLIREHIRIPVPVTDVWTCIEDPRLWPGWNPRVQQIRGLTAIPATGQSFDITYTFRGKNQDFRATIAENQPPHTFILTCNDQSNPNPGDFIRETYRLKTTRRGCCVQHHILICDSRIPRWGILLANLILRFGRTTGPGPLDHLRKTACELAPSR